MKMQEMQTAAKPLDTNPVHALILSASNSHEIYLPKLLKHTVYLPMN